MPRGLANWAGEMIRTARITQSLWSTATATIYWSVLLNSAHSVGYIAVKYDLICRYESPRYDSMKNGPSLLCFGAQCFHCVSVTKYSLLRCFQCTKREKASDILILTSALCGFSLQWDYFTVAIPGCDNSNDDLTARGLIFGSDTFFRPSLFIIPIELILALSGAYGCLWRILPASKYYFFHVILFLSLVMFCIYANYPSPSDFCCNAVWMLSNVCRTIAPRILTTNQNTHGYTIFLFHLFIIQFGPRQEEANIN